MKTHQELDERSLAMHRLIADKIRQNPMLLDKVKNTLSRWRSMLCPGTQPYLAEWEALVHQGVDACLSVATEDSQRATALRQSSPFAGILTNKERFDFLKSWKNEKDGVRLP